VSQSVAFHCPKDLSPTAIQSTLEYAGFDVFTSPSPTTDREEIGSSSGISEAVDRGIACRRRKHIQQCPICQEEEFRSGYDLEVIADQHRVDLKALRADEELPRRHITIRAEEGIHSNHRSSVASGIDRYDDGPFRVVLSIGGMTCSTCSGTITKMVSDISGVSEVTVSFLEKSATVTVDHKHCVDVVVETVEDCGFEAEVMSVESLSALNSDSTTGPRTLTLSIDGMFCP